MKFGLVSGVQLSTIGVSHNLSETRCTACCHGVIPTRVRALHLAVFVFETLHVTVTCVTYFIQSADVNLKFASQKNGLNKNILI